MAGVPSNIIIPFVGVEFDASKANPGPAEVPVQELVIGQRLSSGIIPAETKFIASTPDEVGLNAGFGSVLHRMAIRSFDNNRTVRTVFIGLDDAATAIQGTWTTDITGTATKSGELAFYVAGKRFAVGVNIGDLAATVGAALAALITADPNMPVTAAYATNTLTLTCKNGGVAAADLDARYNYNDGEHIPEGLSVTAVAAGTAGAVDPDLADAIAAIGGEWFNVIAQPYTDNTNMNAMETHLDSVAGPMEQRDGVCYQFVRDSRTAMIAYGEDVTNRNSQWMATLPAYKRMESTYELAAGVAAATAVSIQEDPAVPLHRMTLKGFNTLDRNDLWSPTERNDLARASIATLTDERGVQTEATVTMYRENSAGAADVAYQQQNIVFTLSALRYRFVNRMLSKYPRAKLADSADGVAAGQQIMTPAIGKAEAVAWFRAAQRDGLVEGGSAALEQFQAELRVTRDATNRNRLNFILPPDLMNQFIVGSGVMEFRN